jgi:short-subunit dehydrogenase involved in D-alanine esterification of teichoic acids
MGPLRVIEAFLDKVARSEQKLVVTITSGMGSLTDNTSGGSIAYRTSKAAVNILRADRRLKPNNIHRNIVTGPTKIDAAASGGGQSEKELHP